jgi:hypothetical protein
MPQPSDVSRLRARRDAALASAISAEERIRSLDAAIARAERAGRREEAEHLGQERGIAERASRTGRANATRLDDEAFGGLRDWLAQTPEQIIRTCTDEVPFVLLPIRIETKFAKSAVGTELRVRFFPDDISIAAPPAALSDSDRALGIAYWRARAASRLIAGDEAARRAYQGAWTTLATGVGAYRAGYVVRATAPQNPDAAPGDLVFLDSPAPDEPPIVRAELLPDRFVVLAYAADPTTRALHQVARAVGAPIPDNLMLAPEAEHAESWLSRDEATGRMVVPDGLRWMIDFEAAVAVGMALRLPLNAPHDSTGFDRVIAIGIRSATPPADGPAAVQRLLARHRYGTGCALVPAGTPTNNADMPSGWQPPSGDEQELFAIEDAPPDITPQDGLLGITDGHRLSELLGLDSEFVRRLPRATGTDIAEAKAMNRAAVPGTLDDFVTGFLKGLVTPQTAADLHRFFVEWVTGRGLYPALRVGRQPYGIVVTSAWANWKFPQETRADITPELYDLIARHRFRWQVLAGRAAHAAQPTGDPFERLFGIVGLLASSGEFVSRKAVSDEYIRQRLAFGGASVAAVQHWFDRLRDVRAESLSAIDFPEAPGPTDPLLAFIVFLNETADWRLPLVDRDPIVALSERNPIDPYDGQHNYLWWLTQASRADLTYQRFVKADGTSAAVPTALLYIVLRHAVLAALEGASIDAAQVHGTRYFNVIDRDPLIANIGEEQHVQRRDYLEVDASRLGLTPTPTSLVDWALEASRLPGGSRPSSVDRIAEVQDAISALANLPTARLERLLAEHLDLCSYRLDAWITAIYSQRLAMLQQRREMPGLHLGMFGWIENLRPGTGDRVRVTADALPASLQDAAGPFIFEDESNGGYIHAPSLAQAATAAVLRNGYLSHASSTEPLAFAVNLSSARVRAATALTTGVRAGQPIAALLGYQFERGLHEGHPGIELDQHIATLRDRFPLLSGRLTELPSGSDAALVEARNVVDGLALVEATSGQPYPYAISGLPATGSPAAVAISTEIDRLRDALDAVADVLLGESVHQALQGNIARTQGAQQALTSPAAPPELEVVRTPRSGRVLTFRAMLALDPNAIGGWTGTLSPRARANAQLNHWLSLHLPEPAAIQWRVRIGTAPATVQSFAVLDLEPIDLVLMSGDRLGDQSSELERYVIRRFRAMHAVPDDLVTIVAGAGTSESGPALLFDFSNASPAGTSLSVLQPLLARLRQLITRSRAAHAADWRRAADERYAAAGDATGSAGGDPRLTDFKDLTDRIDGAILSLTTAVSRLRAAIAALAPLRAALETDAASIGNPAFIGRLEDLRHALFAMVPFGIPEGVPVDGLTVSRTLVEQLMRQAVAVLTIGETRLQRGTELRSTAFADPLPADEPARIAETARRNNVLRDSRLEAAKAVLGAAFVILPLFQLTPDHTSEVEQSLAAPPADAATTDEWLLTVARVRPRMADLVWAFAATRWTGHPIADPAVVQLPHSAGTPWIGGTFGDVLKPGEWLSLIVVKTSTEPVSLHAGLLIDDWTETVPSAHETTAVAFNFDRPNAVAPHALLVAVAPELRGHWTWDDLVGSVHEALDLSKLRVVEPDALIRRDANDSPPDGDYFQALPAILAEFTEGRLAVTDFAAAVAAGLTRTQA